MPIRKIRTIISITIVSFVLFLSIGYATVSKNLDLTVGVTGLTQEKVFITDINATTTGGKLDSNSFISSLLTSKVTLNNTSSTVTFEIQVYNNATVPYAYIGTKYGTEELGYDNSNIKFALSISEGDWITDTTANYSKSTSVVPAKSYKTFKITFSHTKSGTNLSLSSVLNFQFVPLSETQVVTLIYNNKTYRDCFFKTETVATFPEITITPTTTANNVARCNGNAIASYANNKITVTRVYSDVYASTHTGVTANNTKNTIKCKVYNSFTDSLRDAGFESSNYTTNNFLVLNDINDSKATAEIPENSRWYINLNEKTITYSYNNKMMKFTKKSRVYINTKGTIKCANSNSAGTDFATIAELNHSEALLQLSGGGTYTCESGGDAILLINGKLEVRWSNITNYGNVFRIGLEPSAEKALSGDSVAGTKNNVVLSVYQGNMKSTAANVVHCTSRQKVHASFVNVDLTAYNTVILCNNVGVNENTDAEPERAVWDNAKFYVTGGTVEGRAHDFFTHGTRLYYTESVSFPATAYPSVSDGFHVDAIIEVLSDGKENYAVLNYTSSVAEDWFYVKDNNGNRMKSSDGTDIKVGDKLEILSSKNNSFAMDLKGGSYSVGQQIQIYADNDTVAQRWTFVISNTSGYYHLATYKKPTYILYTHTASISVDLRKGTQLDSASGKYWRTWRGAKFQVYYQGSTGHYTFKSIIPAKEYNSSWPGQLSLDIPGGTMTSENVIRVHYNNDTDAQIWKVNIKYGK